MITAEARILHEKNELVLMNHNLNSVPAGNFTVEILNLSHNNLNELPPLVFWNSSFKEAKKILLHHNRIVNVSLEAFRGLNELKTVDLSDNDISRLDPYTFNHNVVLEKLLLINNRINFDRLQPFLTSQSIETLILTNNKISHVYEVTFLGLPNLKRLFLNDNNLNLIAPRGFGRLPKLNYLSLAHTLIYQLSENMFDKIPKSVNLEGTPLSQTFDPPLTQLKEESVRKLFVALRRNNF